MRVQLWTLSVTGELIAEAATVRLGAGAAPGVEARGVEPNGGPDLKVVTASPSGPFTDARLCERAGTLFVLQ